MKYSYVTTNNLENRQNYMYSTYAGMKFIEAYEENRKNFLQFHECGNEHMNTVKKESQATQTEMVIEKINLKDKVLMNQLVKGFEVRKRLYENYDWQTGKPLVNTRYDNVNVYICFAEKLCAFYQGTSNLKYLNSLLKINDIIISVSGKLNEKQEKRVSKCIKREMEEVQKLTENKLSKKGL